MALHQMLPLLRKVFHHKFFQKLQPKKVLQNTQSIYILLSSYQSLLVYFQTKNGQPGGAGYLPYKHRTAGLPTSSHIIKCFAFLSLSFLLKKCRMWNTTCGTFYTWVNRDFLCSQGDYDSLLMARFSRKSALAMERATALIMSGSNDPGLAYAHTSTLMP